MNPPSGTDKPSIPNASPERSVSFDALNTGVIQPGESLDADMDSRQAIIAGEVKQANQQLRAHQAAQSRTRLLKFAIIAVLLFAGLGYALLRQGNATKGLEAEQADASKRYSNTTIPLGSISGASGGVSLQNGQTLSINGQLNVNNSLVIAPTTQPSGAVTGQLYYDQASNQLAYYNGTKFVNVLSGNASDFAGVKTVGGQAGDVSLTGGSGIAVNGTTFSNTGVLTLQGEAGNVTLAGGPGIVVNGTTLSSSGVLSLGGQNGDIAIGAGLGMSGNSLRNTGIISATGLGSITVTNDGNGNITIDGPGGSGSGTVSSPGGTAGKIAKFTGVQTIADSLLSDDGTTVTVGGALHVTGTVTLDTPLAVTSGGTGANNAATARTNLGAATRGANSDITSITGLTTALSVSQGGTGVGTLATNGVVIGNGTSGLTSVVAGASGLCLTSTAGAPTWQVCPGSGGVTSVDGLSGVLTIANSTGTGSTITIDDASTSGKGIASFNATNFLVSAGSVNTVQNISVSSTPTFAGLNLSSPLGVASGGTGNPALTANGVLVGNGTSAVNTASGTNGQCLVINGSGAPVFQSCPGTGGVTSINSATGAVTIQGTAGSSVTTVGNSITINDASSTTKGLASFNATNFTVSGGSVNTIQDINTTAAPTFGQLSVVSNQASGKMLTVNNTNPAATGNLLDLQLNGTSKLSVAPSGNLTTTGTITSGLINGQTISSSANFTGSLAVGTTLSVNTISPTGALTVGVGGQSFTLQGNTSSAIKSTNGTNTTTVGFQSPTANVNYSFAAAAAGNYDVCTTAGNCTGVGGGVTTPGGTVNTLAKFTASGTIGNSIITDNGSTVTIGGTLSVNNITPTNPLTVGATSQNLTLQGAAVTLSATSGGITNSLVFATPGGSNKTVTVPNASGTVAVSATGPLSLDALGNLTCPTCLTSGGGGGTSGVSSVNSLTGALTLQGSSAGSITSVGTTITINDASSSTKGLASFNATNLTVTSGNVNTVQDIAVTSTPTFAGLNLTTALTIANGGTGATTAAGARTNLGAAASGANSDITSISGLTTALSVSQGGTGTASLTTGGVLIGNGTSPVSTVTGSNGQCLVWVAGTPVFQACPGSGGVTSVDGLSGALTINNSTGTGSAVTIDNAKADSSTKGIATFNSSNFADNGSGLVSIKTGGVTTTEILDGTIANVDLAGGTYSAITGTGALSAGSLASGFGTINIGSSITTSSTIQGSAATLTGANSLTLGTAGPAGNTGSIKFFNGGSANSITLVTDAETVANATITLPNTAGANDTVCLLLIANCLGGGSGGANTALSNLVGTSINQSLVANANNTLDIGSTSNVWRTGYFGTSVLAPLFDTISAGALSIGTTNATSINIGTNATAHTINIGTDGTTPQTVTIGSQNTTSATTIQGGDAGIAFKVNGSSLSAYNFQIGGVTSFVIDATGRAVFQNLSNTGTPGFAVKDAVGSGGNTIFDINTQTRQSEFRENGILVLQGGITNQSSLLFTGTNTHSDYTSPDGFTANAKISISNYDVGNFNAIIYGGIKNGDSSTARGIAIFDQRGYDPGTVTYTPANLRPAISLLSPGEDDEVGISWDGSDCRTATNCVAKLKTQNSNSSIAIAPNDVPYIKAFSNGAVGLGAAAAGATSQSEVVRIQGGAIANTAGNGSSAPTALGVYGTKGQTTTGAGTNGGGGGNIILQSGDGGNAVSGANGSGGNITLSAGKAGTGGSGGSSGSVTVKNQADSTLAFQVQTTANLNVFTVDTVNGQAVIGNGNNLDGKLVFQNATNGANTVTIKAATQTVGSSTITLPNTAGVNDTVCLQALANCLGGGSGGANTALSNLTSTSINQSLLPDATANNRDLGSATFLWQSGYFSTSLQAPALDSAPSGTLLIGTTNAVGIGIGNSNAGTEVQIVASGTGGQVTLESESAYVNLQGTSVVVQNQGATSSTDTFQVRDIGSNPILNVDTLNSQVTIAGQTDNSELVIKANAASQTAPLIDLQTSGGAEIASLTATTDGSIFFGKSAGNLSLSNGSENIAIGDSTLYNLTTGANNIVIGEEAGKFITTGSGNNAIGQWALITNATGSGNNAFGGGALFQSTGNLNTAVGDSALTNTTTGSDNTAIGERAGMANTTGSGNSALGHSAGDTDYLGTFHTSSNLQDATAIGTYAQVQKSYTIALGSVDEGTQVVIGSTMPVGTNLFGVSPLFYNSTTTATQSGNTITDAGVNFTTLNVKVGMRFIFANGTDGGTITAVGTTTLTVTTSQTVSPGQYFRIHNIGFQVTNSGAAYIQATDANAFSVQNASGIALLNVNTSTSTIIFGTATNGVIFTPTSGLTAAGTARHTKKIKLPAEFAGAVLDAASDAGGANPCSTNNSGTMTSGYDNSASRMNYYLWTSSNAVTSQCYDVIVQVPIPADFDGWTSAPDIQLKKNATGTGSYAVQIIDSTNTIDSNYNYTSPGTLTTSWGNMATSAFGNNTGTNGTTSYVPGDYFTIKVRMGSLNNANVQLGNITLIYNSKF